MDLSLMEKREEFEILEALYDFTASIPQTLSFNREDQFIFHSGNNMAKNWWSVINGKGKMGYIPSNYVTLVKVSKEKLIQFLNHSLENLGQEIAQEGGGTDKQLELMQEIITKRQDLVEKKYKLKGNYKEKVTSSKSLPNSAIESTRKKVVIPPPLRQTLSETKCNISSSNNQINYYMESSNGPVNLDPYASYSLVQQVRNVTGLSYEGARLAVGIVTDGLVDLVPGVGGSLRSFSKQLQNSLGPLPPNILDDTPDAQSLRTSFAHLTACRDDAQQRSWQLWDDESTIKHHIHQITSILSHADPAISNRVVQSNGFSDITMMVEYYQMEDRWSIRLLLLQAFAILCGLDKMIVSIILNSVLPMELAREIQSNLRNSSRLLKPAHLLSLIFSLGEPMPITHLEYLGIDFVKTMIEVIEKEKDTEIADAVLTFILSYNLQFKPQSSTNIIVQSLTEIDCAKTFTERVLLLINREDDPLSNFKIHLKTVHSVLKLLQDLFSTPYTAKLFYTNDVKVLIDIIVRQITDLPPNNEKRTEYLELCKSVMENCDASSFEHRLEDLRSRFSYILLEESPAVPQDRTIVQEITVVLPEFFGNYHQSQRFRSHQYRFPL